MSLTPEEQALFGDAPVRTVPVSKKLPSQSVDDDWGFGDEPTPAPAKKIGKLNFTDESTPEAPRTAKDAANGETVKVPALGEVKIEKTSSGIDGVAPDGKRYPLHETTEAAAVIPPDAPKNDANAAPPAKATKGKKAPAKAIESAAPAGQITDSKIVTVELGPETRVLLKEVSERLETILGYIRNPN